MWKVYWKLDFGDGRVLRKFLIRADIEDAHMCLHDIITSAAILGISEYLVESDLIEIDPNGGKP